MLCRLFDKLTDTWRFIRLPYAESG